MHPSKITIPLFLTLTLVSAVGCTKPGIPVYPDCVQSIERVTTPTRFTLGAGKHQTSHELIIQEGRIKERRIKYATTAINTYPDSTTFTLEVFSTKERKQPSLARCSLEKDANNNISNFELNFPKFEDEGIDFDQTNKYYIEVSEMYKNNLILPTAKEITSGETLFEYPSTIYHNKELITNKSTEKLVGSSYINGTKIIIVTTDEKNIIFKSNDGTYHEAEDMIGFKFYDAESLSPLYSELLVTIRDIANEKTTYVTRIIDSEAFSIIREGTKTEQ